MPLNLEVGRTYAARNGELVELVHKDDAALLYPYSGLNEEGEEYHYTPSGQWMRGYDSPMDLMHEIPLKHYENSLGISRTVRQIVEDGDSSVTTDSLLIANRLRDLGWHVQKQVTYLCEKGKV